MRYARALAIASRHARLLALIRTGDYSSPRLAEELGVSEPTVYRDIEFLKDQGYTIRSEKGPQHWAYRLIDPPAEAVASPQDHRL